MVSTGGERGSRIARTDWLVAGRWPIPWRSVAVFAVLFTAALGFRWHQAAFAPRVSPAKSARQCANNLRQIAGMLLQQRARRVRTGQPWVPAHPTTVYTERLIRHGDESVFFCPEDPAGRDAEAVARRFAALDPARPDPLCTSYAVRDLDRFPLLADGGIGQPLLACPWHGDVVQVLHADGSVRTVAAEGLAPRRGTPRALGPGCGSELLEEFRQLGR